MILSKEELMKPSGDLCRCGADIPVGRKLYSNSPNICTKCCREGRVAAIQVINGKTGNTIQITDAETSARINRLQDRKGGIVSAGMKGTARTTSL